MRHSQHSLLTDLFIIFYINYLKTEILFFRYILDRIKNEHLESKINLIILSDHGMDTITYDKIIFLDQYMSNTKYKIITTGPNAFVYPNPGKKLKQVYRILKAYKTKHL